MQGPGEGNAFKQIHAEVQGWQKLERDSFTVGLGTFWFIAVQTALGYLKKTLESDPAAGPPQSNRLQTYNDCFDEIVRLAKSADQIRRTPSREAGSYRLPSNIQSLKVLDRECDVQWRAFMREALDLNRRHEGHEFPLIGWEPGSEYLNGDAGRYGVVLIRQSGSSASRDTPKMSAVWYLARCVKDFDERLCRMQSAAGS